MVERSSRLPLGSSVDPYAGVVVELPRLCRGRVISIITRVPYRRELPVWDVIPDVKLLEECRAVPVLDAHPYVSSSRRIQGGHCYVCRIIGSVYRCDLVTGTDPWIDEGKGPGRPHEEGDAEEDDRAEGHAAGALSVRIKRLPGAGQVFKPEPATETHMSQSTLDDDELFGEAAEEVRGDVEEALDDARDALPTATDIWEVEGENTLGMLNALRSAMAADEVEGYLRDAKKWYTMGKRADAFEDADDIEEEIEALEAIVVDLGTARDTIGDLTGTIPQLRSALEEYHDD